MSSRFVVLGRSIAFAMPLLLWAGRALADIPAGYKGTPYMGTPWSIPGRIEFENYDDGGENVGWRVDDNTGNFGQGGCAGNDLRMGIHPQICRTNTSVGEIDLYSDGPMKGMKYPSEAMPQSYYIGYTHGADWVKLTVNVAKAGTYKLSSTWASDPGGAGGIKMQILFNDQVKADVSLTGTGGYHNWVDFPDFATVTLEAGVQVLQFAPKSMHLNYDYLQFTLVNGDGTLDPGNADGGAPAMGGGDDGGEMSGSAGAGGSSEMGMAGSTGASGSMSDTTSGSGGGAGAGSPGTTTGGTTTGGTNGMAGGSELMTSPAAANASGCSCTLGTRSRSGGSIALALAGVIALGRRRRRSATSSSGCTPRRSTV
jgi:MYXO-CTERM domain-containing protein